MDKTPPSTGNGDKPAVLDLLEALGRGYGEPHAPLNELNEDVLKQRYEASYLELIRAGTASARARRQLAAELRDARRQRALARSQRRPPLRSLCRVADFFGLETRKAIKALAGDYEPEIRRLRRERRSHAARWNVILAWLYAIWMVLKSPWEWVVRHVLNALRRPL